MKKKIITLFMTVTLTLSTVACSTQPVTNANSGTNMETHPEETKPSENTIEPGTLEELEANVMKDVEGSISSLSNKLNALMTEIDSFDKYTENTNKIEGFYSDIYNESLLLEISLMEHAATYAEFIMNSGTDFDEKYDDLDELYDVVYDDASDEFYDGIYDGILDEMYDIFYDDLLEDAYDTVPYEKWSDTRSNEYEWWMDTRSDCYEIWLDTRSDLYDFWLDLRSDIFGEDTEEATETIADFKEDILDLKEKLPK